MSTLKITDDLKEQIQIGREMISLYDENKRNFVMHQYDNEPIWGGYDSKEDMMYKGIYDYFVYGLTLEQQIYYHLQYAKHEEKKEYLTIQNEFLYKARLNTKKDFYLLEDKWEAYKMLKPYYKREMIKITGENDFNIFKDFISRHPKFIVKPLGLSNTKGVKVVDSDEYEDKKVLFRSFINIGEDYKYDYIVYGGIVEGTVLEELVEQDSAFGIMNPGSINAVRIPTVRVNGKVIPYGCWFKIGVTNELVVGECRDAVMAGIDPDTGTLYTDAITEKGVQHEKHPVSGITFKGFQVPKWGELRSMIDEVASQLKPTINHVGWDVVLTPDKGWAIIEGNYWGQIFKQLVEQKGLAREFGDLIGWHMDEGKFWWQYKISQIEKSAGLR